MTFARRRPTEYAIAKASARARQQLTLIFLAVTIISGGIGGAYAAQYSQFFPALQQLQVNIPSFSFNPSDTSLNATVVFSIVNPSSYSGLTLTDFLANFTIQGPQNLVVPGGLISSFTKISTLNPGKAVKFSIFFPGFLNGPAQVHQAIQNGAAPSQFHFNFTTTLFLSTFLDSYTRVIVVQQCSTTILMGSCVSAAVLLKTNPATSPYGGNG